VNSKKLAGARAAAIGAVTVVGLLVGASGAAYADDPDHDQAYGVAASGLVNVNKIPFVESEDGKHVEKETAGFGQSGINIGKLVVQAEDHKAQSDVKDVKLLNLLKIAAVRTVCDDDDQHTEIVDGWLLGQRLPSHPVANQKLIDLGGLVKVTLGKQTRNDNDSVTVEGVVVELFPGKPDKDEKLSDSDKAALPLVGDLLGGKDLSGVTTLGGLSDKLSTLGLNRDKAAEKIVITSATCFPKGGDGDDGDDNGGGKDGKDKKKGKDAEKAKKSKAVKTHLPVTG
jgi:hypothetical protein